MGLYGITVSLTVQIVPYAGYGTSNPRLILQYPSLDRNPSLVNTRAYGILLSTGTVVTIPNDIQVSITEAEKTPALHVSPKSYYKQILYYFLLFGILFRILLTVTEHLKP